MNYIYFCVTHAYLIADNYHVYLPTKLRNTTKNVLVQGKLELKLHTR